MYKLTGHSLQRGVWFEPESQPMALTERSSTSSITLGPDAPEIGFNDWLLDDEWPEGPIVWRVKSIDDQTDTETVTVSLEHVIRLLEDTKLFDDVATSDIAGGDYCTARQAIEYLLARQSDWVLGDCTGDVSLPYEFNGADSLLDAIESVSETLEDAEWWYDLSQYPFVLHIRQRSSAVMSEMRGGRNVSTLRRSISRSGMYTRIWPVGKNDLHISGDYIGRNESLYGRVDKVETNSGKTTEDGLRAWAEALLKRHCEPLVTITISGLELSQETGEALDRIRLNRVCRCPLPEFRTTILERVIKIQWRDRKKDQESVTVTLGNNAADVRDLTKTVEEASKSGGRGARGQAKQNYLFEANGEHLLYEVFDECGHLHGILRMTSESLRTAFENLNECTRSEFLLTSESLRVQFENEINSTRSEFQMTSESLRVQFENEINSTRSEFQLTSESFRLHFEDEMASARAAIEANAESIRLKVSEGDVMTQLAVEAGNVSISGGNLVVDGMVTATSVQAAISDISSLLVNAIVLTGGLSSGTGDIRTGGTVGGNSVVANGNDISNPIMSVTDGSYSGNTKTVTFTHADGTTETITFNRASGSSKVSGTWTGGTYTVSADENGQDLPIVVNIDSVIADGTVTYSNGLLNVPIKVMAKVGSGSASETGYTQDFKVVPTAAMQAVDVSGSWDGTSGKFTAVSSANSAKKSETTITSVLADGTVTYADGLLNVPIKVMAKVGTGSATDTGYTQDFKVSGTAAYTAGQDDLKNAGGSVRKTTNDTWTLNQYVTTLEVAVPTSNITGLAIDTTNHQIKTSTSSTDQSVTITCEKVARSYTASNNTYVQVFQSKADSSVIATVTDSFVATDAYNAGRDSMWLYSGGTGSNGTLLPGNYAIKEGGSSGTIHGSWVVPNPWVYIVSSGTPLATLGYDVLLQAGCENGGNTHYTPGAIWKTPPDRYQEGYDDGHAQGLIDGACSHTFWGYVGLYQSSITVEGETYSLYLYSQSRKNNATTRVYK